MKKSRFFSKLPVRIPTYSQMNMLMPMLMMNDSGNSTSDDLMMLMMMQSMGNQPLGMDLMMPLLMKDDNDEDSTLLTMVLMNSMTGGMNTQVIIFLFNYQKY